MAYLPLDYLSYSLLVISNHKSKHSQKLLAQRKRPQQLYRLINGFPPISDKSQPGRDIKPVLNLPGINLLVKVENEAMSD